MRTLRYLLASLVTLAVAACRGDSPGAPVTGGLWASSHAADHAREFSALSEPVHLDAPVNSPCQDQTPTLSRDELALYFMSNRRGGLGQDTPDGCQDTNDLWVARRATRDGPWETAVNLGSPVNTSANEAGPALSPDGHVLFFYHWEGTGPRDIYVSRRVQRNGGLGWKAPVKLGPEVNTDNSEAGPSYIRHGEAGGPTLYFYRGDPPVTTDLYAVPITRSGRTRGPVRVLSELNSSVEDNHASVRADGREIFFNSRRPGGVLNPSGQPTFDIWVATRASVHGAWSTPVNLGAPVNSPFAEFHPNLSFDGRTLLFISPSAGRGGLGLFDIWMTTRTANRDVGHDDSGEDEDDGPARQP